MTTGVTGVLRHAAELAARRQPFVLATVIWRRGPSSGQQGAKAVLLADGTVRGWLGGACAEPTVVREARAALEDGHPRLLFLGQAHELDARTHDGWLTVAMACESEGAMEVYLEPVLPAPHLVVVGRSPAVHALTVMASALGWQVDVIDDAGDSAEHPMPEVVHTSLDLAGLGLGPESAVLVATQGHYDDVALREALATPAGYVGLVASAKRAHGVLEYLRDAGVAERDVARVHAPAGLDLGPVPQHEIAVAVLADLVGRRARGELVGTAELPPAPIEAIDPVCGMTVVVAEARYRTVHEGREHVFCAPGCLRAFEADPVAFLAGG